MYYKHTARICGFICVYTIVEFMIRKCVLTYNISTIRCVHPITQGRSNSIHVTLFNMYAKATNGHVCSIKSLTAIPELSLYLKASFTSRLTVLTVVG